MILDLPQPEFSPFSIRRVDYAMPTATFDDHWTHQQQQKRAKASEWHWSTGSRRFIAAIWESLDRLSKFRPDAHRKRTARQSISNLKFCQIAASELPFTFKSLNAHYSASELNSNRFDVYGAASNDKATNKQTNKQTLMEGQRRKKGNWITFSSLIWLELIVLHFTWIDDLS